MPDERPPDDERPRDPAKWAEPITERKAWRRASLPHRPTADFFDLAEPIVKSRHTIMAYDKLYALWQAARNVADVPGSVAEVGAYRGGSAYFIACALIGFTGAEVPMHVFDTFSGHPGDAITEHDTVHEAGHYGTAKYKKVVAYLSRFGRLQVHQGDVSALLPELRDEMYRLVHIDTNLYKPTRDCLEYFGRRMTAGGVIVVDDYSSENCPGVEKASVEYLRRTPGRFAVWDVRTEQLVLVARGRT
jgi:hypothetical protein